MAVIASECPSPLPPSLCLGLTIHYPSKRHHAPFLLGPSFHDLRLPHVLESNHEPAAPISHRNGKQHAVRVGSYSTSELHLYLAACHPSSICHFWVLDHLCYNVFQPRVSWFHFTLAESQKPDLGTCMRVLKFSSSTSAFLARVQNKLQFGVLVCNLVGITRTIPLLLLR